jgi:hypothetical protein
MSCLIIARTEKLGGNGALVYQRIEPPSSRGWRDCGVPGHMSDVRCPMSDVPGRIAHPILDPERRRLLRLAPVPLSGEKSSTPRRGRRLRQATTRPEMSRRLATSRA